MPPSARPTQHAVTRPGWRGQGADKARVAEPPCRLLRARPCPCPRVDTRGASNVPVIFAEYQQRWYLPVGTEPHRYQVVPTVSIPGTGTVVPTLRYYHRRYSVVPAHRYQVLVLRVPVEPVLLAPVPPNRPIHIPSVPVASSFLVYSDDIAVFEYDTKDRSFAKNV